MWQIPLFDLNYDAREEEAVQEVLKSRWLTSGERTQAFEDAFASYLGHDVHALALSSCTAALHLSLLCAGVGPGDEVIISGLSFVACLNVVSVVGATPVLADSKSLEDWNVSPGDIAAKVTSRTKAIIVVHFAGYPCDMDEINRIARNHGLLVIEDVAHAVGAEYRGQKCGTLGDLACFSFFSNKNLSVGEGGMVVTSDSQRHEMLKLLRSHGMTSMTVDRHNQKAISYDVAMHGLNYRIDEMRSALGLVQLDKLDDGNRRRAAHVTSYHQLLAEEEGIVIPWKTQPDQRLSSYHIFPVLLPEGINRRQVMDLLRGQGVQTSLHYPSYREFSGYKGGLRGETPVADIISSRVLTLPLYPTMSVQQIEVVVSQLRKAIQSA